MIKLLQQRVVNLIISLIQQFRQFNNSQDKVLLTQQNNNQIMRTRGEFSKASPFNYQSHQSLNKFKKLPIQQRAQQLSQQIFKIKLKGQQVKQIVRNVEVEETKQLRKHIKILQTQLKRKILENPLLSKVLKAKHNQNITQIDLYLEFLKVKQQQDIDQKLIQGLKDKELQLINQIQHLKNQFQQKEQHFIQQIQKATYQFHQLQQQFFKKIQQKQKTFERQSIQRQTKIQQNGFLIEQMKRKNHKLSKDLKDSQHKVKDSQSKLIEIKKIQNQKYKKLNEQYSALKKAIQTQQTTHSEIIKSLKTKNTSLENVITQKQLQIQQLDRFIELQKDSNEEKLHQARQKYQQKIIQLQIINEEQINRMKEQYQYKHQYYKQQQQQKRQRAILKLNNEQNKYQQKIQQLYQHIKVVEQKQKQKLTQIQQLKKTLQQLKTTYNEQKSQFQKQKTLLTSQKSNLTTQIHQLTKKLKSFQQKTQLFQKQSQQLNYQLKQMQSKVQKGYVHEQNQIRNYQCVVEDLERRIYLLGNQNVTLKKNINQAKNVENKCKDMNKLNQQAYAQKYKVMGRVEQIIHKIQQILVQQKPSTHNSISFRSSSHHQSSTLTQTMQLLSLLLDKLLQSYTLLKYQNLSKNQQFIQDQREIQYLVNNLIGLAGDQQLSGMVFDYFNIRKLVYQGNSTHHQDNSHYELQKNKKFNFQTIRDHFIQQKLIKQYSSTDTYRTNQNYHIPNQTLQKSMKRQRNLLKSSFNNTNPIHHSKKTFKIYNQQNDKMYNKQKDKKQNQSDQENNDNLSQIDYQNSQNNDSLEGSYKRALFNSKQQRQQIQSQRKIMKQKLLSSNCRQSLLPYRSKQQIIAKYGSRLSTQPVLPQNVQQQSTYEINQNLNCQNFVPPIFKTGQKRYSLIKQKSNFSKVKQSSKQKLLNKKDGISKGDIQRKYFIR